MKKEIVKINRINPSQSPFNHVVKPSLEQQFLPKKVILLKIESK
jgi:hypothetical protein